MPDDNMDCSLQQLDRTVPTEDKSADVIHLDLSKHLNDLQPISPTHMQRDANKGNTWEKKKTNGVVTQEVNFYNQRWFVFSAKKVF